MGLNINNEEAHRFTRELAERTGQSKTEAVTVAVRERLERLRHESAAGLAERLLTIGRACAARLKEPYPSADHADPLYNELGLPR